MKKDTFIIFFWPAISSLLFFIFALYIMLEGHLHEDIYINLNYAKNIANGDGIIFFEGGPRTEAVSDFLFTILVSFIAFFGIDLGIASALLNSLGAFLITYISILVCRQNNNFLNIQLIGLGSTILLIGSPIIANSIGGWSTLLYSGLITLIFFILWKSDLNKLYLIPWLGLFLSLYRPDGVVVGIASCFVALYLIFSNKNNQIKKFILNSLFAAICGIIYLIWRYYYFGLVLPLPFYVKTNYETQIPGLNDTIRWFLNIAPFIPSLLLIPLLNKDTKRFFISLLPFVLLILSFIFINPLQNYGFRYQNSTFGIFIVLYLYFISYFFNILYINLKDNKLYKFFSILIVCILLSFNSLYIARWALEWELRFLTSNDLVNHFSFQLRNKTNINSKIALTEAGKFPYWANGQILDLVGLNSKDVAINGLDYSKVEKFRPEIFFLHTVRTIKTDQCLEQEYKKITTQELTNYRLSQSINWKQLAQPNMRAPGVAMDYIINNDFHIYLFCFDNEYTHLFAFNEKSNLEVKFVNKKLKELGDGKYNYSYFDMVKILNSEKKL
tara:strand:+ start:5183 stop:6850 length:1668 start_codon:yes stop_codon:yes gene_type:complete